MSQFEKLLWAILSGQSDANLRFDDLLKVLQRLGFAVRIRGSHHIAFREGIEEIINVQPSGSFAKPYQVRQVRNLIVKYQLVPKGESHE